MDADIGKWHSGEHGIFMLMHTMFDILKTRKVEKMTQYWYF